MRKFKSMAIYDDLENGKIWMHDKEYDKDILGACPLESIITFCLSEDRAISYSDIVKVVKDVSQYTDGQIAGKVRDMKKKGLIKNKEYGSYILSSQSEVDILIEKINDISETLRDKEFLEDVYKNHEEYALLIMDIRAKFDDIQSYIDDYSADIIRSEFYKNVNK